MQSVQNLGLAVISIVAGKLVDSNGYLVLEVFFLAWLCGKWAVNSSVFGPRDLANRAACLTHTAVVLVILMSPRAAPNNPPPPYLKVWPRGLDAGTAPLLMLCPETRQSQFKKPARLYFDAMLFCYTECMFLLQWLCSQLLGCIYLTPQETENLTGPQNRRQRIIADSGELRNLFEASAHEHCCTNSGQQFLGWARRAALWSRFSVVIVVALTSYPGSLHCLPTAHPWAWNCLLSPNVHSWWGGGERKIAEKCSIAKSQSNRFTIMLCFVGRSEKKPMKMTNSGSLFLLLTSLESQTLRRNFFSQILKLRAISLLQSVKCFIFLQCFFFFRNQKRSKTSYCENVHHFEGLVLKRRNVLQPAVFGFLAT